jgi:hypothetical protein
MRPLSERQFLWTTATTYATQCLGFPCNAVWLACADRSSTVHINAERLPVQQAHEAVGPFVGEKFAARPEEPAVGADQLLVGAVPEAVVAGTVP